MKRIIASVLVLLVSLTLVPSAHAASKPDPKRVSLTLQDMPAGFTQKTGTYHSNAVNAKANHESLAKVVASGRMVSYETEYQSESLLGLLEVDATTVLYRTTAQARAVLQQDMARANSAGTSILTPMSAPRIGTQSATWTYALTKNGTAYAIEFVRGAYGVRLLTGGIKNTFTPASTIHFAQLIDARIVASFKH